MAVICSSSFQGLTQSEANARLERDGLNRLPPAKRAPSLVIFLLQLVKGFSLVLWVATALCLIAYGISILQQDTRMEYVSSGSVGMVTYLLGD